MNRNTNTRFALNPTRLDMSRSRFDRSCSIKTSFDVGQLIPFYVDEILPGDTFTVDTSKVVRLQTLLTPVMDNIYLDTYFFFVPSRLCWSHWRELMGENTQSAWIPTVEYSIPQITSPAETGWQVGTIADYMGIPTGVPGLSVSALPFRAYALICNEWFRDENLSDPLNIPVDDVNVAGVNTGNYITDVVKGGQPFVAAKYHDYFTSCLPSPQKGPDVSLPVGVSSPLPVGPGDAHLSGPLSATMTVGQGLNPAPTLKRNLQLTGNNDVQSFAPGITGYDNSSSLTPLNLWAFPSADSALSVTINQLRLAFQIQKLYERDARGGTRYIEILKSHFGVTSPDARLQRPEYLGGNRIPININQVVQNSATESSGTPQGTTTAYSLTSDTHSEFTKSFVEHGFIIGLMVARYDHTYQQGLARMWSRKDRFDFYWPVFANIGEQAVLNKEIYAQGNDKDQEVFGYQEAWAEYRYRPSSVTGEMRSQYAQSLDVWHLADDYESLPSLSDGWIREDKSNVDRVLAVSSSVSDQLFCDVYIRCLASRPMPLYSIPGLIDHH